MNERQLNIIAVLVSLSLALNFLLFVRQLDISRELHAFKNAVPVYALRTEAKK